MKKHTCKICNTTFSDKPYNFKGAAVCSICAESWISGAKKSLKKYRRQIQQVEEELKMIYPMEENE